MLEQDDEIYQQDGSMGVGKALTLFFGLALVCGVLFGIGYNVGKTAGQNQSSAAMPSTTTPFYDTAPKPQAGHREEPSAPAPALLSENKSADSDTKTETSAPAAELTNAKQPAVTTKSATNSHVPVASGVAVQVAAVRHEEDAEALAAALRKKDYPVYLANNPGDALFHVQVGPFHDVKEAEGIKQRLASDGYNAIVKK